MEHTLTLLKQYDASIPHSSHELWGGMQCTGSKGIIPLEPVHCNYINWLCAQEFWQEFLWHDQNIVSTRAIIQRQQLLSLVLICWNRGRLHEQFDQPPHHSTWSEFLQAVQSTSTLIDVNKLIDYQIECTWVFRHRHLMLWALSLSN